MDKQKAKTILEKFGAKDKLSPQEESLVQKARGVVEAKPESENAKKSSLARKMQRKAEPSKKKAKFGNMQPATLDSIRNLKKPEPEPDFQPAMPPVPLN